MFALTGAAQGVLLWWLWHVRLVGAETPALTALLYATLAVPLVIYCTQDIERLPARVRRAAVVGYLVAYALLGAYTAWVQGAMRNALAVPPVTALASFVLGFVSLHLLCGFDFQTRRWDYARLFHASWRNGILLATAAAMTGLVWLVLLAGAGLMQLIGVRWIMDLIREPAFAFPVTGVVSASAFAMGLVRASLTESIRRFQLSIASWLLPLALSFGVLWVLALPWTGLEALFQTRKATLMMLGFTTLAVVFSNCAYQDGQVGWPYPRWLSLATQAAWLSLLPVVAIAWWALGLRIDQHGLTELRLWASLSATLAGIYAIGYALSWRDTGRWMEGIARTNIAAALVLCGGLLAFLTPLGNVQRLAVQSHLRHLAAAEDAAEPDWRYLRWQSGRFGREALAAMASGQGVPPSRPWARQASEALAQTSRYAAKPSPVELNEPTLREKFVVLPEGKALPESFVQHVLSSAQPWEFRDCLGAKAPCAFWLGDLDDDGADEIVLFHPATYRNGTLFQLSGHRWVRAGFLSAQGKRALMEAEQLAQAHAQPAQWRDLLIGGRRFRVSLHD